MSIPTTPPDKDTLPLQAAEPVRSKGPARALMALVCLLAIACAALNISRRLAPHPDAPQVRIGGLKDTAAPFLQNLKDHKFDAAYSLLSAAWQKRQSSAEFAKSEMDSLRQFGSLNHTALYKQVAPTMPDGPVSATYFITGSSKTGFLDLSLVSEAGHYRVDSVAVRPQ